jgi:predicted outer membrane lipoprotein
MNTSTVKAAIGRRLWITGLVLAIAAALVSALWLTSSSSPATATMSQTAATLDAELSQDPSGQEDPADAKADRQALHADMKAARQLTGQARVDALKKVAADARAGKYGDKIEKRFERRAAHRAAVFALLPDELQADLKKLRAMEPGDERKAYRDEIRQKALDGGYGDKVQEAAEKLHDFWRN